jgi:protein Shroom
MLQTRQHLSKDLLGPMIMGPIISVDDWVPERPPKNPTLRIPSPELPPPPPALVLDIESDDDVMQLSNQDEPLPPPPPEILHHVHQQSRSGDLSPKQIAASSPASRRNSFAGQTANRKQLQQQQSSQYRFDNKKHLSPSPPALPKKPPSLELLIKRPSSSMSATNTKDSILQQHATSHMHQAQQQQLAHPVAHNHTHIVQAHRVMLNGNGNPEVPSKLLHHNNSSNNSINNNSNSNMSRLHNDHSHHQRMSLRKRSHNSHVPLQELTLKSTLLSPPPLKPRIPIMTDMNNSSIGSKLR